MVKKILRVVILIAIFGAAIVLISHFTNQNDEDLTTQMSAPTYPVVTMQSDGHEVNTLRGHKNEMTINYIRETVTPVNEDSMIPFKIDTYGNEIEAVSYELWKTNGVFYLAGQVTDLQPGENNIVSGMIPVEQYIDDGKEYMLRLIVQTKRENAISYYTRIVQTEQLQTGYMVNFAKEFSEKTFDKQAAESLTGYLETSEAGINSSFSYANINSTFEHITWEDLNPVRDTEPVAAIQEISYMEATNTTIASVTVGYRIRTEEDGNNVYYDVVDFYRLSYAPGGVTYVLDFERNANQLFDVAADNLTSKGVVLGIVDADVQYVCDEDGKVVSFVQNGGLYCYNKDADELVEVFSYVGDDKDDIRNTYQDYKIKIIDIDENGNTNFIVCGYANRGNHEGETGAIIYSYSAEKNSVEEKAFLPSSRSSSVLVDEIETLAYMNAEDMLYIYFDGAIYEIDLEARSNTVIRSGICKAQFAATTDQHIIAWQKEGGIHDATAIVMKNLDTGKEQEITVGSTERIQPLGFIDSDFIYGIARTDDIRGSQTGITTFPMYVVRVQDQNGRVQSEHQESGNVYVSGIELLDDVIRLLRVTYDNGLFAETSNSVITRNEEKEERSITVGSFTTERYKRQIRLNFGSTLTDLKPIVRRPSQIAFTISRDMNLEEETMGRTLYFAYGHGVFQGVYDQVYQAVAKADEVKGVAVSSNGTIIWQRGSAAWTYLEVEAAAADENTSTLAACLNAMLRYEGIQADTQELLNNGSTAMDILADKLETAVVDLSGSVLSENNQNQALQMIASGCPVLAVKDNGNAILIIGYNAYSIFIMDPEAGTTGTTISKDEAEAMFGRAGNVYITYER